MKKINYIKNIKPQTCNKLLVRYFIQKCKIEEKYKKLSYLYAPKIYCKNID